MLDRNAEEEAAVKELVKKLTGEPATTQAAVQRAPSDRIRDDAAADHSCRWSLSASSRAANSAGEHCPIRSSRRCTATDLTCSA